MAVRDFDGSNDSIVLDNGAIGAFNEAGDSHTIVAILKPALTANPQAAFSIRAGVTSDNMASLYFADDGTTHNGTDDPSGVSYTGSGFVDTSWQIVAVSKGAGTVAARFHRKVLGSGSWSHTDGTGTIGTTTSVASECRVGEFSNAAGDYDGLIAVIAFYATVLSDAQVESIQTTPSTQTLLDLGAVGLWEFNQASTATSVVDRTGGGADQTSITGTTVVTDDDPPGWTFGVEGIQVDVANLGTNYLVGDQSSITLTTTAAVAAGGFIVLWVGGFAWNPTISVGTVTGGGLTWTVDKLYNPGPSSTDGCAIISAQAPSGLAASTVITVPATGGTGLFVYPIIGGCSFTGVATSSPVDGTPLGVNGTGTTWTSGSYAISEGSAIVGGVYADSGDSLAATAGTELWDRNNGGGPSAHGVYRIESSSGSYALSGSWTGSGGYAGAAVAYRAAGWTHLQSNDAPTAGPLAFGSNVALGSLLVVGIESADSSFPYAAPTDTLGNTYQEINQLQTSNGQGIAWWYAVSEAAGANTVTFEALNLIFSGCFISEYSCDGDIALDVEDIVERDPMSIGTDTVVSPSVVASENDSLVIGLLGTDNGSGSTITAGTDFTLRTDTNLDSAAGDDLVTASRVLASAGSTTATFSVATNSHRGAVGIAVFKVAAEGYPAGSAAWVTTL